MKLTPPGSASMRQRDPTGGGALRGRDHAHAACRGVDIESRTHRRDRSRRRGRRQDRAAPPARSARSRSRAARSTMADALAGASRQARPGAMKIALLGCGPGTTVRAPRNEAVKAWPADRTAPSAFRPRQACPRSSRATRSDIASASSWSWVTNSGGDRQALLQRADLVAHLGAQMRIEVRQRLVEQQHARLDHQRAPERDALLLPAGELRRIALREMRQRDHSSDCAGFARGARPRRMCASAGRRRRSRAPSDAGTAHRTGTPRPCCACASAVRVTSSAVDQHAAGGLARRSPRPCAASSSCRSQRVQATRRVRRARHRASSDRRRAPRHRSRSGASSIRWGSRGVSHAATESIRREGARR